MIGYCLNYIYIYVIYLNEECFIMYLIMIIIVTILVIIAIITIIILIILILTYISQNITATLLMWSRLDCKSLGMGQMVKICIWNEFFSNTDCFCEYFSHIHEITYTFFDKFMHTYSWMYTCIRTCMFILIFL
jgi:hypothetical protein